MPHLRNLTLTVAYRELPKHAEQLRTWGSTQKWKGDPDADSRHGFAPRNKYYINGQYVGEERPGFSDTSNDPFPESPVPRRGLMAVRPDDPDYAKICQEQGLRHLLKGQSPAFPNGLHSPASSAGLNGDYAHPRPVNGTSTPKLFSPTAEQKPLVNGVHDGTT